jgi:hypothetical protein
VAGLNTDINRFVDLTKIDIMVGGKPTWIGVSYSCPSCQVVLSVGFDPIALKSDAVKEILDGLHKR